jgi:hypothetical protein
LITGRKVTGRSIASRLVDPVDQSSLNRFLTLYEWDEQRLNRRRLETLQSIEEMRWRGKGVTALDDSLLPKTGRKMPGAGKFWDPSSKSYVHAQCLVTSQYVDLEKDTQWASDSTSSMAAERRGRTASGARWIWQWS